MSKTSLNHRMYNNIGKKDIQNFGNDNIVILKPLDKKVFIVTMNYEE